MGTLCSVLHSVFYAIYVGLWFIVIWDPEDGDADDVCVRWLWIEVMTHVYGWLWSVRWCCCVMCLIIYCRWLCLLHLTIVHSDDWWMRCVVAVDYVYWSLCWWRLLMVIMNVDFAWSRLMWVMRMTKLAMLAILCFDACWRLTIAGLFGRWLGSLRRWWLAVVDIGWTAMAIATR